MKSLAPAARLGPKRAGLALAALTLLSACSSLVREQGEIQAFESAVVMDDGHTTLFTANRARFEYAGGDPWGKGERIFKSDRLLIGTYDLETGEVRVVHTEEAEPRSAGRTRYRIRSTRGPYALLSRYCGPRVDDTSRAGWYRFDVRSGELLRLDLARDLAARGAGELRDALLVSDEGDLVALSRPVEGQERSTVSLRRASGTWVEVASDAKYRGVKAGELYCWSPGAPMQAWSLASGERRDVHPRETLGMDHERETKPKAAVMPRDMQRETGSYLELYPDRSDNGATRRLPLRVEDLDVP